MLLTNITANVGNSVSDVFPQPLELTSVPPNWAIAIIAAAAGVTFLWILALFILVRITFHVLDSITIEILFVGQILLEICHKRCCFARTDANVQYSTAQQFVKPNLAVSQDLTRAATVSLGSPPPPISTQATPEGTIVF